MAHEFNNLLGAIQGFANLIIEDAGKNNSVGNYASQIIDASRSGLRLIEKLSMVSGHGEGCRGPTDVAELVDEVVAEFAAAAPPNLSLHAEKHAARLTVYADRNLLARALLNLCANAADALKAGAGVIEISVQPAGLDPAIATRLPRFAKDIIPGQITVFQDGGAFWAMGGAFCHDLDECICLAVTDTGPGMDRELLLRAFDPFFTTRERAIHPGLGLSIVHGVTVAHCGAVVIDTAPGCGTRARMILPPAVQ